MTLARQPGEKMERSDSGFGDCPEIPLSSAARTRGSSIGSSTKQISAEGHLGDQHEAPRSESNRSRVPHKSYPFTTYRTVSHQSSASIYDPRSCVPSRRSSFVVRDPATRSTILPYLRSQSHTLSHSRPETSNPYLFHRECQSLFDPPEKSPESTPIQSEHSFRTAKTSHDDIATRQPTNASVQSTTIDWTFPTTRRREYEKIEASTRGIRGLWRRFAPKRCQRNSRLAFYDGDPHKTDDDSDAGSVRRYRVSLEDEPHATVTHIKILPQTKIRGWRCFGRHKHENVDGLL